MPRALCGCCLESHPSESLTTVSGRVLCPACADRSAGTGSATATALASDLASDLAPNLASDLPPAPELETEPDARRGAKRSRLRPDTGRTGP
jgi:hypothetical protein